MNNLEGGKKKGNMLDLGRLDSMSEEGENVQDGGNGKWNEYLCFTKSFFWATTNFLLSKSSLTLL